MNIIAIAILRRECSKTKSYEFLQSLAASDLLIGIILGPLTAWQLFDQNIRLNCYADMARGYLMVLFVGSSNIKLALIAYDRYILLTKLKNYKQYMTTRKYVFLITFSWICPALVPILKFGGKFVYLCLANVVFMSATVILILSYFCLIRVVKKQESVMQSHKKNSITLQKLRGPTTILNEKSTFKRQKLENVTLTLILAHLICTVPMFVWTLANLTDAFFHGLNHYVEHVMYLCAVTMYQMSSCCNPVIYFFKNSSFTKCVKKMLHRKSSKVDSRILKREVPLRKHRTLLSSYHGAGILMYDYNSEDKDEIVTPKNIQIV
ncbi:trace amine-associated receptor 8c-like [Hydractinia symbiolongicarpus]|uniref:trace amine-associated receptor 8c-like n=1 Tax=Hydractinia symbiolongicarpus TaxID=13093 RepID=UPI00254E73B6|nr:trace amine-associated receptor 8c-like [Hydractinia symbiolongicarpus]